MIARYSLPAVFLCGLLSALSLTCVSAAPPASLEEWLTGSTWSWIREGAKEQTQVQFESASVVNHVSQNNPWTGRWEKIAPMVVTLTHERQVWTLTFNPDLVSFTGVRAGNGVRVRGVRMGAAVAGGARTPGAPAVGGQSALAITPKFTGFGGMSLAADWMPRKTETRKELLNSLEFYASAALEKTGGNGEVVPTTLLGPIRWLMPLEEAIATLPRGAARTAETRITSICFPQNSLSLVGFQTRYFVDLNQRFNLLYFIVDTERRVVALELVSQAPKEVLWAPPGPDGDRNPYYDFVNLKANGRTGQKVDYQIRTSENGVCLIKTALYDFKKLSYLENVHWYLPAPFARSLMEIVDYNRKAGMAR